MMTRVDNFGDQLHRQTGMGPEPRHCAHAEDRSRQASEALAAAEAACQARGSRLTPIRRRVLEALYATHRPLGAYDIAQTLTLPGERALAPITIYRALEFLIGQGFAHRLASRNAFVACSHGHDPGAFVAFLICETCGGVDEFCAGEVAGAIRGVLEAQDFAPSYQLLEISGHCAHCREGSHLAGSPAQAAAHAAAIGRT